MSRLLIPLAFILLIISNVALSADVQHGLDAYNKGDYKTAMKEWRPLAEQGDALAQGRLGGMYYFGIGIEQDLKQAIK